MSLGAADRFTLHQGWSVVVPRDAAELTVRFQASSAAEVDLYVQRHGAVWAESPDDGETPRIHADFESTAPDGYTTVTISRGSTPPLTTAMEHIALGVPPAGSTVSGTLSVEVPRSGIVQAWQAAFPFVASSGSEPDSQTVQLTHETAIPVRYRIDSRRSWRSAYLAG